MSDSKGRRTALQLLLAGGAVSAANHNRRPIPMRTGWFQSAVVPRAAAARQLRNPRTTPTDPFRREECDQSVCFSLPQYLRYVNMVK